MGLDLAQSFLSFLLFCAAELLFIAIPMLVFRFQKKDLKYEFRHRIIPNETLHRRGWWRVFDVAIGVIIGGGFYLIGNLAITWIRKITVQYLGDDYYQQAVIGSINTTPPPPPNPIIAWIYLIIGVILMFLVVAFAEEFCFRGVLLKEFNHISKILGVILSSAIFMIYHVFPGIVPVETFVTFWSYYLLFGLLLAFISMVMKGDLIIVITAHGVYNSIGWILIFLPYL